MVGETKRKGPRFQSGNRSIIKMGLLGKVIVRIIFSVSVVTLFVFGVLKVTTIADMFNSSLLVFAVISANILLERYLSSEAEEQ